MILNLKKKIIKRVEYHHFKMNTFKSVINLGKTDIYFASIYESVPNAKEMGNN